MIPLSFVLFFGLLPSAWSVVCVFLDPFSKGSNFTDLQIIWHTHTDKMLVVHLSCQLLFIVPPLLWPSLLLQHLTHFMRKYGAVNCWCLWKLRFCSYFCRWTLRDLWKIAHVPSFSWEQQWWVKRNSQILASADTSVLVQIRRILWKCVSQSSQLCLYCWVVLEHRTCSSLGATEQVLEGFGSWIPLQLIKQESPETESTVHCTFLYKCAPVGASPDSADV